jgi:ABC-type transport system substrate-binding protein
MREQSNVGQRIFYTFAETLSDHAWTGDLSLRPGLAESQWENEEMIGLMAALQDSTDMDKRRATFRRMLTITEREDPAYNVIHQNATFTAKRRDYKWRPAQSFVVDFRSSNWG